MEGMFLMFMLLIVFIYLIYKFKQAEEFDQRIFRLEVKMFGDDVSEADLPPPEVQKWMEEVIRLEHDVEDLEKELENAKAEIQGLERNKGAECVNGANCPVCEAISSVPGAK